MCGYIIFFSWDNVFIYSAIKNILNEIIYRGKLYKFISNMIYIFQVIILDIIILYI